MARVVIDMYAGVIGGFSKRVDHAVFKDLKEIVEQQILIDKNLFEIKGQIDMMARMAAIA